MTTIDAMKQALAVLEEKNSPVYSSTGVREEALEILAKSKPCPRCPTESDEREALIEYVRRHAREFGDSEMHKVADMLAADAPKQ